MKLEAQIVAAFALDLTLGDPPGWPHPVRVIGAFAARLERPLRKRVAARAAGVMAASLVVGATVAAAGAILASAHRFGGQAAADVTSIFLLYTTLATRDLAKSAGQVWQALHRGDLGAARQLLGRIVGRDTADLDESAVARAAVETVAENLVDGVASPLLFAVLFGPIGACAFKAISTLDSMFGYQNERYLEFGWASARLDDAANYLPARLTAPLVALGAAALDLDAAAALRVLARDGRRHSSPNAGLSEAAFAGALGVQLGGPSRYGGISVEKPVLGDARHPIGPDHIRIACRLMQATAVAALLAFVSARLWLTRGGVP